MLHRHRSSMERLSGEMNGRKELAAAAIESGNGQMYLLLQRELNDMYLRYLSWSFLDGVGFLIPHVLAVWIIGVLLPHQLLPWPGGSISVLIWYAAAAVTVTIGGRRFCACPREAADGVNFRLIAQNIRRRFGR